MRTYPLLLLLFATGCSYRVWSPPARAVPASGVGALNAGEVRAQASASYHASIDAFDDRPQASGGATEVGIGLGENLDLRFGGQALYFGGGGPSELNRGLLAGRAGLRWAPLRWFVLSGGLGAGSSAGGAFLNPDLGVTFGDGSEYVGFFVDLRVGASLPVDPATLDLTLPGDEERSFATPGPTLIVQITPGLRLTLLTRRMSDVGIQIRIAPNATVLVDEELTSFWFGGALVFELTFGG